MKTFTSLPISDSCMMSHGNVLLTVVDADVDHRPVGSSENLEEKPTWTTDEAIDTSDGPSNAVSVALHKTSNSHTILCDDCDQSFHLADEDTGDVASQSKRQSDEGQNAAAGEDNRNDAVDKDHDDSDKNDTAADEEEYTDTVDDEQVFIIM